MKKILVSACLAGTPVRYDGKPATMHHELMVRWISEGRAILSCPEVLGGLPTPRDPAEIVGGNGHDVLEGKARVVTTTGADVTDAFIKGANRALVVAQKHEVSAALLQARSPSCGKQIYDGTFSKTCIDEPGVTAALFERHNIRVFGPEEIQLADTFLES